MRTVLLTILGCAWVVVFLVAGVLTFDAPRTWMAHLLSGQEAAVAAATISTGTTTAPVVANTAASSSPQDTSAATAPDIAPRTTYEYKLLSNVTACKLSLLGADGWHPIQFGGSLATGYDPSVGCRNLGTVDALDWALLERPSVPAQ